MPTKVEQASRLSVAPMLDWTDRNCRLFHRILSQETLLYTEMVTAPALVHGDPARHLDYYAQEHPVALQLGGSDPRELETATRIASDWGYDEINLNCGCPSDRVQSGAFGAVLMKSPEIVAEGVAAMMSATTAEVTVKCRIGVDDQEPRDVLPDFLEKVSAAGVKRFTIHARKAWLKGLSPRENRDIPPLDYDLVHEMKAAFPHLHLSLNGGVKTLEEAEALLAKGLDGVMIGRAAYHEPFEILGAADQRLFGTSHSITAEEAVHAMLPHIEAHLQNGGRLHQFSRHMLGLFAGRPGARAWKRIISEDSTRPGAGPEVLLRAMAQLQPSEEAC